jgi:hypothetical protein
LMFTMKHFAGTIAAAALLATAGAHAQSKKELVQKVIALQTPAVESLGRTVAQQTSGQVLQAVGQSLQRMPADKREPIAKAVRDEVQKFYNEVEPVLRQQAVKLAPSALGPKLEEKLTEDELKQVIAWLESSASKKFAEIGPDMQKSLGDMLIADTRPVVEPKLKALEQSLIKQLTAAAGPAPAAPAARASAPKK